ncbi:MAG: hypothetical protein DBY35_09810 [Bacteroidales bacterium]|nr:MAG: hypothetical protein DBY35_09810 [Bacteroidales bacterium]
MNHGWEKKRLGDVCKVTMGQSPESSSYNNTGDGMPFFQGCSDFGVMFPRVTKYCSAPTRIAENNDILFSVRAPIGTMNFANCKCCIGRGLCSISPKSDNQRYVYYALICSLNKIIEKGTGSTFKAVGKDVMNGHYILLPSKEIQNRIASELDKINELIEIKRSQLADLDLLAQSLFYEMFGDPITNPKGWENSTIGDVASVQTGATPSREISDYYIGDIPWVKTTEVQNCDIYETEEHISRNALENSNCKLFPLDTIIVAMYGQGKTRGQIARLKIEACTNQACAAILPCPKLHPLFLYAFLRLSYESLRSIAVGCNQKNLNLSLVKNYTIFLPPILLQNEFAAKLEAIEEQKKLIKSSIKDLRTLFASRMDYWFNEI